MLIEFSVSNFRSIHHRQSLSMVPGTSREVRSRFCHHTDSKAMPHVLKSAALFGANGSGKSTIVQALAFMKTFVVDSAREGQEGDLIDVTPFLLGEENNVNPSEFEIVFIADGVRYQYGFSANSDRVHEEWLYVVPATGRMQRWFERRYDEETGNVEWYINPSLRGEKEIWRKSTRNNALFLSSAVQLKGEVFSPIFNWFRSNLKVIISSQRLTDNYTASQCKNSALRARILSVLEAVDTGIVDFQIDEEEFDEDSIPDVITEELRANLIKSMKGQKFYEVRTGRNVPGRGNVYLDIKDESDGTRVLFALAGPWLDTLDNGYTLVVDELSNSLHPLAFHYLVSLVNNEANSTGAQLVFTTHDTTVMMAKRLHADQINFVEKNAHFETSIRPLSDFEVRSEEAIQKGYLGGRYGGLPKIYEELV
ncbi:MAG: ATP-binding protein [Novosphingobium pentaromativorans]|uniref:ATP-binding protein n=1 Tax=Novosphingobium pentaromativorans TaxID=205844 RepID=A0A2W5NQR9_9SPHN|nr:MAG: ATP-binding protein [Novosphingobium pentaromativorans]